MHGTCIKITVNVFYNRPVERLEFHQKKKFLLPGSPERTIDILRERICAFGSFLRRWLHDTGLKATEYC